MQIEFIGGAQTVTGSQHLLHINGKKVLLLTELNNQNIYKSGRNIPKVKVLEASKASTYDLLNNQILILQKSAVKEIEKTFAASEEVVG